MKGATSENKRGRHDARPKARWFIAASQAVIRYVIAR
jgi:hypothetical protein